MGGDKLKEQQFSPLMQTIYHCPSAHAREVSQEVTDMIIDQLAEELPSLKSCALVCRRWRPRSHYQLFKLVKITSEKGGSSLYRWCSTFSGMELPVHYDM